MLEEIQKNTLLGLQWDPNWNCQEHTACIWFWMAKDVGVASDSNFSSY